MPRLAKQKTQNISYRKPAPYVKKTMKKGYKRKSTYSPERFDRHMAAYHKILAAPFSEYVHPAPVPDGFAGRTVTMKLIYNQTISTDVNGAWAANYFPSPDQFVRNYDVINSDVPNDFLGFIQHPQWTQYVSSAFSVKPVCLGVKVSYTGRQELMSGLTSFLISNESTSSQIPAISTWGGEQGTHAYTGPTRNHCIEAVSKLHDLPEFKSVPTLAADHVQSMSSILVGGSGWPASSAIAYVESVLYLEILPKINSALSFSEKPSGTSKSFTTETENHIGVSAPLAKPKPRGRRPKSAGPTLSG